TTIRVGPRLGRYEIISQLGTGGMGEIYLANDTQLDRRVALKLLSERYTGNALWLRRFIREAEAASGLNHPNIITIPEICPAGGQSLFHRNRRHRRQNIEAASPRRADEDRRRDQYRLAGGKRLGGGACRGNHPPRHQTGKCHAAARWLREGARFRAGEAGRAG